VKRLILLIVALLACVGRLALHADSLAQIHTPLGDLLLQLYDADKPATVGNFQRYITNGLYRDSIVQRWEPGFVIQGGGYWITNRNTTNAFFSTVVSFGNITNEFNVGRTFSNTYGTIAMARVSGETNSANSQWFINLTNNAFLDSVDGGFTVFGTTLLGTNVLNQFNDVSTNGIIWYVDLSTIGYPDLATLPVLTNQLATWADIFPNFVYTDFSLPAWPRVTAQVNADGTRLLSWNSLSNFVNHVDFTTNLAVPWQTLVSTNGVGGTMQFLDTNAPAAGQFYRVRVQ
jgi:cyclophilin family peptidyl-prolyl cis-trans isomerase